MGKRYHRRHQRGVAGALVNAVDERPVDLERVELEPLEVAERRVAGAKVVHRKTDAHRADLGHDVHRGRRVLHDETLGQLNGQMPRVHSRVRKRAPERPADAPLPELARADVDRHRQRWQPCVLPVAHLPGGLPDDPVAERHDEPALLGDGYERTRCHHALTGADPAKQRLGGVHAAVRDGHDRLVEERELVAFQCELELGLGARVLLGTLLKAFVEEHVPAAPLLLRTMHRRVGVPDDRVGGQIGTAAAEDDADARRDRNASGLGRYRLFERREHAPGKLERTGTIGIDVREDPELVPADAGDDLPRAGCGREPRTDAREDPVGGDVAELLVDLSEPVEVEVQHDEPVAGLMGSAVHGESQPFEEVRAVGDAGERISHRSLDQGALTLDVVGDVNDDQQQCLRAFVLGGGAVDAHLVRVAEVVHVRPGTRAMPHGGRLGKPLLQVDPLRLGPQPCGGPPGESPGNAVEPLGSLVQRQDLKVRAADDEHRQRVVAEQVVRVVPLWLCHGRLRVGDVCAR